MRKSTKRAVQVVVAAVVVWAVAAAIYVSHLRNTYIQLIREGKQKTQQR